MPGSSLWAVQQAVHAALVADAGVQALVGTRVHDHVPDAPTFPYLVVGESVAAPFDTKSWNGLDHDATVHAWSRHRGQKEAKQMLDAVHACLHAAAFAVAGHGLVLCRLAFVQVFDDPDGLTRHGVARYRIVTHA